MSENVSLIVTAVPNMEEAEAMQGYLQGVAPLLGASSGEVLKRVKVERAIAGHPVGMVLVMRFDHEADIDAIFASDEYAALIPLREKGFHEMNIMVARDF